MTEQAGTPSTMRRLDSAEARRLARFVGVWDDLQTVLRCAEQLMSLLADPNRRPDDVLVDALWTLTLISYGRGFAVVDGVAPLSEDDIQPPEPQDRTGFDPEAARAEALRWHRVLVALRDQHAGDEVNPRETYTVGLAQAADGAVTGVAVTSVPGPVIDQEAVRQAGVTAYLLCAILDGRIAQLQQDILDDARTVSKNRLAKMDVIQVAAPA